MVPRQDEMVNIDQNIHKDVQHLEGHVLDRDLATVRIVDHKIRANGLRSLVIYAARPVGHVRSNHEFTASEFSQDIDDYA